jgi:hypothetical protein
MPLFGGAFLLENTMDKKEKQAWEWIANHPSDRIVIKDYAQKKLDDEAKRVKDESK